MPCTYNARTTTEAATVSAPGEEATVEEAGSIAVDVASTAATATTTTTREVAASVAPTTVAEAATRARAADTEITTIVTIETIETMPMTIGSSRKSTMVRKMMTMMAMM